MAGLASMTALDQLNEDPDVLAVEASRGMIEEVAVSIPFVRGDAVHRPPVAENGSSSLIAIIDDGIDLLHRCFEDGWGHSRVVAVWDQTDTTGQPPSKRGYPSQFDFGTLHTDADIATYLAGHSFKGNLSRNISIQPGEGGHGTHVASIAAGRAVDKFAGGMAPGAKIVFVRPTLRVGPGDPFSIGYSLSHVVALSFIDHLAEMLSLPVVVNVSMGMNAGAHDGTSALEAAFDGFSLGGRKPGRVIVKSAGNERQHDGHASLNLSDGTLERLRWESKEAHHGTDNIELWFHSSDDLAFRLEAPDHTGTGWVDSSNPTTSGEFSPGISYGVTLDRYCIDNGDSRLLVTISATNGTTIPAGKFVLEIDSRAIRSPGRLDAWIERGAWRPIFFIDHVDEEITLSVPGTARTVVAVASVGNQKPLVSSAFSSKGLSRDLRQKPDLCAPGDRISGALSGTAGDTVTMSGTSMAAPHVTGAVALLFSHCSKHGRPTPNAMQVIAALRNTTQNFNGRHNSSFGYGILDVEALLASF